METMYERIKRLRKAIDMRQTELASLMGYSDKSMIAKIEAGKVDLTQSKIVAAAKALRTRTLTKRLQQRAFFAFVQQLRGFFTR